MFIALYRWQLKPGSEENFREGWRRLTEEIYRRHGSLGSRLHRAEDGTWIAYAQWPDKESWQRRGESIEDTAAVALLRESIEIGYPEVYMDVIDDLLK